MLGVTLPGLPVTPFLLLATWLFTHSSPKLLNLLMRNKYLSNYVNGYHKRGGMTKRKKIFVIIFMWTMVTISVCLRIESVIIKFIIISMALIGTFVMGFVVPTAKNK